MRVPPLDQQLVASPGHKPAAKVLEDKQTKKQMYKQTKKQTPNVDFAPTQKSRQYRWSWSGNSPSSTFIRGDIS